MKKILSILIFILALCSSMNNTFAQGVTSSSMSGTIIDETGAGLAGATIIAIHEPTGSRYATTTDANGRYRLPNVQVGGPYRVTASFVGYETREQTDLYLSLGQNYSLDLNMKEESVSLGGVEIYGTKDDILNSDRTGAATNVGQERIQALPTLTRSIDDYVRLTPQANTNLNASGGISLGGANNRFNNITIDGAVNNDVFGLSGTGQPGGQTGATSISLDAIQELQVNLAPYDVRQGNFTGQEGVSMLLHAVVQTNWKVLYMHLCAINIQLA
ncbi:MAG: carboxypeptidase regulatory-like domain-containing protein [Cytophagales bacterium]|nr:MAG: carboxypeptidase regulatory-like domain-containing protein [Cytophagales bacterium]